MVLLVSSMSARGRALRVGRPVVQILRSGGWHVDVEVTTSIEDVSEVSRKCDAAYIGALGGDGYMTSVAAGRVHDDRPLLPIPAGRGNDLCRALGITTDALEWAEILARATDEEVESWIRPLDAMEVASGGKKKMALGIVSFGIDAKANQIANETWVRSGPLAYAWGAASGYMGKFKPQPITALFNGEEHEVGGWFTAVSNSGWFGGGINVIPQSDTSDGVLEIVWVEKIQRARALPLLAKVLLLRNLDHPLVHLHTASEVQLTEPAGLSAFADGDVIGAVPLTVKMLPGALQVVGYPGAAGLAKDLESTDDQHFPTVSKKSDEDEL